MTVAVLVSILMALAPARAGQPAHASMLTSADAFERFSATNDAGRFRAPLFGEAKISDLREDNCSGVLLPRGSRVLIESSGKDYGLEFRREGAPRQTAIGGVFLESDVTIGGTPVPAGAYIVFASVEAIMFGSDAKPEGGTPVRHMLKLRQAIPEARLERAAADRPRLALEIRARAVWLTVASNDFRIVAR